MPQKLNISKHLFFFILTTAMCEFKFTTEKKNTNYEEHIPGMAAMSFVDLLPNKTSITGPKYF